MTAAAATIGAFLAWLLFRDRRRRQLPGRTSIVSPRRLHPVAPDGSVHSVQSAQLELPRAELERLWTPAQLENLGRTYWLFLTRVTLGRDPRGLQPTTSASVVLLTKPLTLLRFEPPAVHGRARPRKPQLGDPRRPAGLSRGPRLGVPVDPRAP